MPFDPHVVAADWLALCASTLTNADVNATTRLLLPDGWLRDLLVFTWDFRSLEGHDKVAAYLANTLAKARITDVHLDDSTADLAPRLFIWPQLRVTGVELAFTFECHHGHGRGYARLLPDCDGAFKAYTLLAELADLAGHEELGTLRFRDDLAKSDNKAKPLHILKLSEDFAKWKHDVETKPYVLIVGAAQTGLQIAARFKQMNIPTLAIDRAAKIGDVWRARYPRSPSTPLGHTIALADWIEFYAVIQDLIVWTKTELKEPPHYEPSSYCWHVKLIRDGVEVELRPAHIVLATGTAAKPYIPPIPDMNRFRGELLHSSTFPGGDAYAGKRVVVIGAGNSSIDICQELVEHGATSVTIIQRSETCAVSRDYQHGMLNSAFPDGVPQAVVDFKTASLPNLVLKRLMIAAEPEVSKIHEEMHDKLRKGGLKVNLGPEGQGLYVLFLERAGGTDKGYAADMVEDGKIQAYHGASPARFTENAVVLDDGTEMTADVVVLSTGYLRIREASKELMGENVINQIEAVFGLDEEGEIQGSYRPCGHPGLWFATGDFSHSRSMSKHLALQIKAIQLRVLVHDGQRVSAFDIEG
ncbi:dimethylaniline monooxygenase (N-oxide-forming) [Daedaleopsis nitida]|nr:dimethylaniline monooxygenase (N-oxide-forming) [Daedaleopsis nitida]